MADKRKSRTSCEKPFIGHSKEDVPDKGLPAIRTTEGGKDGQTDGVTYTILWSRIKMKSLYFLKFKSWMKERDLVF